MDISPKRKPKAKPKPKPKAWYKPASENVQELPEHTQKIIEILKLDFRK